MFSLHLDLWLIHISTKIKSEKIVSSLDLYRGTDQLVSFLYKFDEKHHLVSTLIGCILIRRCIVKNLILPGFSQQDLQKIIYSESI